MTKFYVYKHEDSKYEFVPEHLLEQFAYLSFKPEKTTFTGVMIHAESPEKAMQAYNNPTNQDADYMLVEEPDITMIKARLYETKSKILEELLSEQQQIKILLQSREVHAKLLELNIMLSKLAREIHSAKQNVQESVETTYVQLRVNALLQWPELFRYIPDGDTEKT